MNIQSLKFTGRTDAEAESSNTLATWWEELTHWKRPWCWERLKAGGEGDDRGWDGWMASPTRWTCVWASSGSWWWTGNPGMPQSMGHNELDTTEWLNWTDGPMGHCSAILSTFMYIWNWNLNSKIFFKKGPGRPSALYIMDLPLQVFLKSSRHFQSHPPWMRIFASPCPSALGLIELWSLLLFFKFCPFNGWKSSLCCFNFHFLNLEWDWTSFPKFFYSFLFFF